MPPTLTEVKAALKRVQDKHREPTMNQALLETAAVKATDLTNHPAWDRFLEQCQAMLDANEAQAKAWTDKLKRSFKEEDMREAQMEVICYETRAMTLRHIMQLPGAVLKEYADAAESR